MKVEEIISNIIDEVLGFAEFDGLPESLDGQITAHLSVENYNTILKHYTKAIKEVENE